MEEEKYLPELMAEKDSLDPSFTHALRLVNREIEKFQKGEGKEEEKYIDVVINKNMKLGQKVLIPVKQFPKDYNDEIRQAQLQELTYLNGGSESTEVPLARGKPLLRARGGPAPVLTRGRGGATSRPAGVPRGGPAPRGVPPNRGPVSRGRGLLTPRARGAPPPAGYRPPPPPSASETYGEYEYDDGYGTAYDEQSYDSYDNSYSTPAQSGTDYYDYGHGLSEETYDSYGQEEWTNSRHKAPPARTAKAVYRDQPYARY
uniref:KH RNA binding domain containing, signal transduction associated 3 n=1 Tax=Ornithorhynchus anatinus TaxID=9258 RepID=A0A6I8NKF3_ORNAN